MENVCGDPAQETPKLVIDGVTEIFPVMAVFPAFVDVNAAMFPLPEAARLIAVLELVHA